ncbi:MAG: site-2 protease family protein [Planctomycetota bacterium]
MESAIGLGLVWYAMFLFSTTCHEAAHAWTAMKLGDPTAKEGGQASLDPLPHIRREPLGMVVFPVVTFFLTGWTVGWASAPYDPFWADRHPRRAALMALAGPAANLLLILAAGIVLRIGLDTGGFHLPARLAFERVAVGTEGGPAGAAATLASVMFSLNLILFLFNLMPLAPLDGTALWALVLPERAGRALLTRLRDPAVQMLALIALWTGFRFILAPVYAGALLLLYRGLH